MAALKGPNFNFKNAITGQPAVRPLVRESDQSEDDAFRAVEGSKQAFDKAAKNAFGNRSDPLRVYGEEFVAAGAAQLQAIRAMTDRNARACAMLEQALNFHHRDGHTSPNFPSPIVFDPNATFFSRLKGVSGYMAAACAAVFAAGVAFGHLHADGAVAATARLNELRSEAIEASSVVAQAKAGLSHTAVNLQEALGASQSGLSIIHRLSTLPETERTAIDDIISDWAFRDQPGSLRTVRDLLRLSPLDREVAFGFASLGTQEFRTEFLSISRLAEAHTKFVFFQGERNFPGCVTNGPVLHAWNGFGIKTCLVEVPSTWAEPDTVLRRIYTGE